ncbi:MAG: cell division protein ZapE, partial [Cocleimonas sp.]
MTQTFKLLEAIKKGGITPDADQRVAIELLQKIGEQLINAPEFVSLQEDNKPSAKKSFFSFLKPSKPESIEYKSAIIKGLYLWGDVGRGKTWLMDVFYSTLPSFTIQKQRIHFHAFMLQVHKKLQDLPAQSDPLTLIGKQMAQEINLLCLDEFHVMDIADAVILQGLLKALFENGVTVITTSNRPPDDLYKNGSHRERFLPAIALIKLHCHIHQLDANTDYRLLRKAQNNVYFIPHIDTTNQQLTARFNDLTTSRTISGKNIKILGREIPIILFAKDCVWFHFDALCRGMRANKDYIEIAAHYKTVIVSEIPELHEGEEGPARRFLNMIDAFYDQHVYLVLSAHIELDAIYKGELLVFEF